MPVLYRTIAASTTTTIPAPINYPASGAFNVTVDANNPYNLQYTGASPLDNWGTPPATGTNQPIVIDGETGINPWATGLGTLGYTYLLISGFASLPKVLGIQFLALTSGTYTYLIQTDTDCTSVNSPTAFQIVFGKCVGYSGVVNSAACTLNGTTFPAAYTFNEPQLSPMSRHDGFFPPVLVVTAAGTVTVTENY